MAPRSKKSDPLQVESDPVSLFYRRNADGYEDLLIYTRDMSVRKHIKDEPTIYFRNGKVVGYHWICVEGDATYKALWKHLALTPDQEKKEKRTRRTKAEMQLARKD